MVEVYAVKIDEKFDEVKFRKFLTCISWEKLERVERYFHIQDKQRVLIGDILVRYLICKKLFFDNKQLVFSKNKFGKPFLVNNRRIHYNISHSGEWVLCAIHDLPVGIDIEEILPLDYRIAERFFQKNEYQNLMNKEGLAKLEYFYEIWTLKESYIKAMGKGLNIPLESFSFSFSNGIIKIETTKKRTNFFFKQYHFDKRYKVAVCALKNTFVNTIHTIDIKELYDWVLFT